MAATLATNRNTGIPRRTLSVVVLFSLLSMFLVISNAPKADAATVGRRWYGADLYLNRNETNNLMAGAGIAGIAAAMPEPALSKIVAASLGAYVVYANWVYNRGGCMKFRVTYTGGVYPAHYFGGYCR